MRVQKSFAAILLGAIALAGSAFATSYKCNIRENGLYGAIPSVLVFSVNEEESKAVIYYALIKYLYERPIEAKLVVANPKRYTFKWSVDVPTSENNRTTIKTDYRASYIRGTRKISLRGFPRGFDVEFTGAGKCIPVK